MNTAVQVLEGLFIVHNRPRAIYEDLQAAVLPHPAGVGATIHKASLAFILPCTSDCH